MLRGGIVLFTALFSIVFLGRRVPLYQWAALGAVTTGIGLVGAASILNAPSATVMDVSTSKEALGVFLILFALLFGAGMFVLEERILSKYRVDPLEGVGLEGLFGFGTVVLVSPFLYLLWGKDHKGGFLDVVSGWNQFWGTELVWKIGILICFSIAGFNFFGLSVTKRVSSTARATIDASRTLFIWMISMYLGWESFKWLQVGGFVLLIYGTFLYNGVVHPPQWMHSDAESEVVDNEEGDPILRGRRREQDDQ
jgi:multidrug transporter EmrE-like cation transporter